MANLLSHLLGRRLLVQCGKGGTGKSTLSAALALVAARHGKRVLLVGVGEEDRFGPLFGRSSPLGYHVEELSSGVFGTVLDPYEVVGDFFATHIRVRPVYEQILRSKVFRTFYEAGPGLRGLICLGKIWRLVSERKHWDTIIVDAPATGHGIAMLAIAEAAHDTLFGPMKRNARHIRDMLRDAKTTALNVITLAEEMPINEAVELCQYAHTDLHMHIGAVLVNAFVEPLGAGVRPYLASEAGGEAATAVFGEGAAAALLDGVAWREQRAALASFQLERLREAVSAPIRTVPYLYRPATSVADLEELSQSLELVLAAGDQAQRCARVL